MSEMVYWVDKEWVDFVDRNHSDYEELKQRDKDEYVGRLFRQAPFELNDEFWSWLSAIGRLAQGKLLAGDLEVRLERTERDLKRLFDLVPKPIKRGTPLSAVEMEIVRMRAGRN